MNISTLQDKRYTQYYQKIAPFLQQTKKNSYAPAVLTFLAVSLFGWYAVKPTLQTILFLRREIKDLTLTNSQMEQKIQSLIESESSYRSIEQSLPLINSALPDNPEILALVSTIRNISTATHASISAINTNATPIVSSEEKEKIALTDQLQVTEVNINIVAEGDHSSLLAFMKQLLLMDRLVTIESIQFIPSKTLLTDTSLPLQLNCQIKTFYLTSQG